MKVSQKLEAAGFSKYRECRSGGTSAWHAVEAGLPADEGKKAMSLERQALRIAAGSLVVIGAAVGQFVQPAWVCSVRLYRGGIGLCRRDTMPAWHGHR